MSTTGIQRALITGGAGFIGSHLADALLAGGVQVGIYANLSTGRRGFTEAAVARGASLHDLVAVEAPAPAGDRALAGPCSPRPRARYSRPGL